MTEAAVPAPHRLQRPAWIRVRAPSGENYGQLKSLAHGLALHTVCEEALCPNMGECWGVGTATFMILGDTCTRACRFCAIATGNPRGRVDAEEPARVARAIAQLKLNYAVITSVDRDDLPDGGAEIFAETVRQIKAKSPATLVEVLTPDFRGTPEHVRAVVAAQPDVFGHNIETVRRLTSVVRDRRAGYDQTLNVLRLVKEFDPTRRTKYQVFHSGRHRGAAG
jgi:lipoic acid synthetase